MNLAFRLLARRARSEAEVRRVLEGAGHSRTVVRRVLGRLRRLGYIDDVKLAADVAERLRERGFGSLRIRDQLERLGVGEGAATRVGGTAAEELRLARETLKGRFGEEAFADERLRGRAARWLAARGFTEEIIASVLPFDEST